MKRPTLLLSIIVLVCTLLHGINGVCKRVGDLERRMPVVLYFKTVYVMESQEEQTGDDVIPPGFWIGAYLTPGQIQELVEHAEAYSLSPSQSEEEPESGAEP